MVFAMDWIILAQVLWNGLERGAVYVLFALGLTLGFGVMRIMNMAHGELCMLGGMGVYTLMKYFGFPFFPAAGLCIVLVAIFGIIFNRLAVRPLVLESPLSVLLSTIAVSFILVHGGNALWGPVPRVLDFPYPQVLRLGGVSISLKGLTLVIVAATAVTGLYLFLARAKIGKVMRATSQNSIGARLVGINTERTYTYTMIVASALAAIAGIFLLPVLASSPAMGQGLLITGFVIVIVGGMGNVTGCVLIGLAIGIIEALFGQYVNMLFRSAFIYSIMIIVLLVKPEGLFARR
jgi:branched-chain amino acid transport system permease protein